MNNEEQVTKLQGLLARIRRNAAEPRAAAPLPPPAAFAPVPPLPAEPAPAPAPPIAAYSAPNSVDQSVDDLLDGAEPLDVDVPLETIPPAAEAEPIPLVSVSTHATHETAPPPAAEPLDATFSLESEVSEVRITTAPRPPAPEVTVAAIEAEAEPIAAEELSEDDLVEVEVTEGTPLPGATDVDLDFEEEEEQPPASSKRQVAATTMDEALAAAVAQAETEHEAPLKTPPPESGPQAAPLPAITAPPSPDVDALLGQELEIPTRSDVAAIGPTAEQLGQTIDLEEARGPSLELAEAQQSSLPPPSEELEVALPGREVAGGYDESLLPPPEALGDLEAHRRRSEEDIAPPPESLARWPSEQPGPAPEIVPVQAAPIVETTPEVVARSAPEGSPETFTSIREPFRPTTFVQLLDASLSL
jgi:hypothetical protein